MRYWIMGLLMLGIVGADLSDFMPLWDPGVDLSFRPEVYELPDGTDLVRDSPNSIRIDNKISIESSVKPIMNYNGKKEEWAYASSGYETINMQGCHIEGMYLVSDICTEKDYTKTCKAIHYEPALKCHDVEVCRVWEDGQKEECRMVQDCYDTLSLTKESKDLCKATWEGFLDPTITEYSSSTMCNSPHVCKNVTTYHGNLTMNVSTKYTPPKLYLPFDIGSNGCTKSQELVRGKYGVCTGNGVNINNSASHFGFGKGLSVAGSDDYFNMSINDIPLISGDISIEAWIFDKSSSDNSRMILIYWNSTEYFMIVTSANNQLLSSRKTGGTTERTRRVTSSNSFNPNVWNHIAATYTSASNTWVMYVNGARYDDGGESGYGIGTNPGLFIGIRNDLSSDFNGYIDNVAIYNYVMTNDQVNFSYKNGLRATSGKWQTNVSGSSFNRINFTTVMTENNSVGVSIKSAADTFAPNSVLNEITSTTNFYWNYTFTSTNASRYFLLNNIETDFWNEGAPPADTCLCENGQSWHVDASDGCTLQSTCNVLPGYLNCTGSGELRLNATLTSNFTFLQYKASTCKLVVKSEITENGRMVLYP